MNTSSQLPLLGLEEVVKQLKVTAARINTFATVIHNSYMQSMDVGSGQAEPLYRVTVYVNSRDSISLEAYTLSYRWFGIRAYRTEGHEETLLAAWLFNAVRPRPAHEHGPICIKCLSQHADGDCLSTIDVSTINLEDLARVLTTWTSDTLPAEARVDRRPRV